ncbi:hypothetical protein cyc_03718 [Cyclospora cayetanensis]|uniref:Uncharacterized protein n=1 Tax=Cyclospora cayetanensis TaxID=88456 RepID=A0A1D3CXB5_9EIME|nr:hypothetical protein cyc_03718 [Cyclospora cayetanensis]
MDPLTIVRWFGVCTEPPIEEAQPAWWVELQHSEALQRRMEKCSSARDGIAGARSANVRRKVDKRKVQFAPDLVADRELGYYESNAEFVIPKASTTLRGMPAVQKAATRQVPPWDLADLDDTNRMRRILIPEAATSCSCLCGSVSAKSLTDKKDDKAFPSVEGVFRGYHESSDDELSQGSSSWRI